MRLDAYYYGFDATGVEAIDNVLSAVACAGKAFHLTEDWSEPVGELYEPTHRGETPVQWIQNAATDAATAIQSLRREVERLTAQLNAAPGRWNKERVLREQAERERDAARAQVERLRGLLVDAVAFGGNAHTRHHPACMCSYTQEASKNLDNCNCWVRAARAALADAAGEGPSK